MVYPETGRGIAKPASDWDKQQDAHGLTNPNLHRRVDSKQPPEDSGEVLPRDYKFAIMGHDSFRRTANFIQDENSDVVEVP